MRTQFSLRGKFEILRGVILSHEIRLFASLRVTEGEGLRMTERSLLGVILKSLS